MSRAGAASGGAGTGGAAASSAGAAGAKGDADFDIVIGVDLGSSGSEVAIGYPSGSAFNLAAAAEQLAVPGGGAKIATSLLLNADAELTVREFGDDAEKTFHRLRADGVPCILAPNFKLALKPPEDGSVREVPVMSIMFPATHSNGSEVPIALSLLITRALERLKARAEMYLKLRGAPVDTLRKRWVLTVPAVWDDPAKGLMRYCAAEAGLVESPESPYLLIAIEPECAMLRALSDVPPKDKEAMGTVGASTIVVDAGGGTVDIVLDEVTANTPGFKFRELSAAGGNFSGGLRVDEAFRSFLRALLGADNVDRAGRGAEVEVMSSWRNEKCFIGDPGKPADSHFAYVQLGPILTELDEIEDLDYNSKTEVTRACGLCNSGLKASGIIEDIEKDGIVYQSKRKVLAIPWRVCEKLFIDDPVRETATAVTEFLQAVSDRGDPLPTRCVLVGGFANSVSLTAAVSASAAAFAVPTIKPTDTWTTVVKGAVLFGLQPRIDIIEERILRFTYAYLGVETPFNPAVHHKDMEFKDKGGRALVLIPLKQKGDRVKTGDTVETPSLTRALATQTQVDFRLYALPEKIPECIPGVPGRRWTVLQEGVTSTGDNPHVRDLQRACLITVPFAPGASSNCKLRLQFGGAAIIAQAIDESTGKTVESAIKY